VPEPGKHGLLDGVAGRRGAREVAAESRQVLVVLTEQHFHDPSRRDEAEEVALRVDDGE
jgi:hypothetical protein